MWFQKEWKKIAVGQCDDCGLKWFYVKVGESGWNLECTNCMYENHKRVNSPNPEHISIVAKAKVGKHPFSGTGIIPEDFNMSEIFGPAPLRIRRMVVSTAAETYSKGGFSNHLFFLGLLLHSALKPVTYENVVRAAVDNRYRTALLEESQGRKHSVAQKLRGDLWMNRIAEAFWTEPAMTFAQLAKREKNLLHQVVNICRKLADRYSWNQEGSPHFELDVNSARTYLKALKRIRKKLTKIKGSVLEPYEKTSLDIFLEWLQKQHPPSMSREQERINWSKWVAKKATEYFGRGSELP